MTAFEFDISPKDAAGVFSVDRINEAVLRAVGARTRSQRITKSEIARRLGIDKSTVSRLLRGNQNLTARTMGELLWALDFDFDLVLHDMLEHGQNTGSNHTLAAKDERTPNKIVVRPSADPKPTRSYSSGGFVKKFETPKAA